MANLGSEGERILQKKVGSENKASAFYDKQMLDYLNPYMRKFILKQEMVFIATADSKGECDCSFRAGKQGFVRVLNEKTDAQSQLNHFEWCFFHSLMYF